MKFGESEGQNQNHDQATADSSHLSLNRLLKSKRFQDDTALSYPTKSNRYFKYGWNQQYQYCYTNDEISLLDHVRQKYHLIDAENIPPQLQLATEKRFYDYWSCSTPVDKVLKLNLDSRSFTLPTRETKDASMYPLWQYADAMARQIADWQSLRSRKQKTDLMNDPTMLFFEMIKYWFFDQLAEMGTKKEDVETISAWRKFIGNLKHTVQDYGADRYYLHELQTSLEHASRIVNLHHSNKKLPQLLIDVLIRGKDLENVVGTYLHLLNNEVVSDNYSDNYLQGEGRSCLSSPVCKLNYMAKLEMETEDKGQLSILHTFNKFYRYSLVNNEKFEGEKVQATLRTNLVSKIQFASYVTDKDKHVYLEALALLESLVTMRTTLEFFKRTQENIGTHVFSDNYLQGIEKLSKNYIELISKTQDLMSQLLKKANEGFSLLLKGGSKFREENRNYIRNFEILEMHVSPETNINNQVVESCNKLIESINIYQMAVTKLAHEMGTGEASQEIENEMRNLYLQMQKINSLLPGIVNQHLIALSEINEIAPHANIALSEGSMSANDNRYVKLPFDYGLWDKDVRVDPVTKQPIYVFRVFKNDEEVGCLELFSKQFICKSEDSKHHNIINMNGVFENYSINDDMSIVDICEALPPTLFDKVYYYATNGALHGFLRGSTQVLAVSLKSYGIKNFQAEIASSALYYSTLFSMNFYQYYQQHDEEALLANYMQAIYHSAWETGKILIINTVLSELNKQLQKASAYYQTNKNNIMSYGLYGLGKLFKFGVFAASAAEVGIIETGAAVIAGALSEGATEIAGHCLLNKINS